MASFNIEGCSKAFLTVSVALLLSSSLVVGIDRAVLSPMIVPGGSSRMCPSDEARQAGLESFKSDIKMLLNTSLQRAAINDYCGPGQWHRVAFINMTDPQQNCPVEWQEYRANTSRGCGRVATCSRKMFSISRQYSKVCGRIIAYQLASTDAFQSGNGSIDGAYVDGVSVTYGSSPRNHIWTFAGGWSEISHPNSNIHNCPCSDSPGTTLHHHLLVRGTSVNQQIRMRCSEITTFIPVTSCGMVSNVITKVPAAPISLPLGFLLRFLHRQSMI